MIIKILGSGCKKCVTLGENAKAAAAAAGKEAEIIKVTDFAEIAAYRSFGNQFRSTPPGRGRHRIWRFSPVQA